MVSTPFDSAESSIPVTVVTTAGAERLVEKGAAILHLEPALHDHAQGNDCVACAARGDVRAMLFDLLSEVRLGRRNPFPSVIVDATAIADPRPVIDRLERGVVPALGLRDHTVARSFHLSRVI